VYLHTISSFDNYQRSLGYNSITASAFTLFCVEVQMLHQTTTNPPLVLQKFKFLASSVVQMSIYLYLQPSLVRIDAHNFELSWQQTHKQTHKRSHKLTNTQTGPITIYTAPLGLARSVMNEI